MKLKELSKEMGGRAGGLMGGLDTLQDREPVLTSSSLSMDVRDAEAFVALAKELGIDRVNVIGAKEPAPQLFGPVWFIRIVGRWSMPNREVLPWDAALARTRRLLTEHPGAAALESTWRVAGLIGLLQLVDANQ